MSITCDINTLEALIVRWPGVEGPFLSKGGSQVIFSIAGVKFTWISPDIGMVQLYPPLGADQGTRRLERHGSQVTVIRQRTGQQDAEFYDPGRRLEFKWSYPGFMCSQVPQDEAESLVRQAYEQARSAGPVARGPRGAGEPHASFPYASQRGIPTSPSSKVVQVPMEEALVRALDSWSKELGSSRAEVIREACRRYLKHLEREKLDRIYREGYDRFPEEPIMALTQQALLSQVLPKEDW